MLLQIITIARATFIESIRQPVLFVLVTLSGFFQVFNTWNTGFSMGQTESSQVGADNKLLFDIGLATVFVCGTLLAAFIATAVMSREIENKTVLTIVSKPVARASLVLGKYAGVAAAIIIAVLLMLIFLMMGIRHGVMSTAADELDGPVIVFSLAALVLAVGIGGWCNYFYGMNFPQTAVLLMVPFFLVAYAGVLLVGKEWKIQPITKDLKDQVLVGCAALGMAILVLTAVATAASTRLGQVMTIVTCVGVLVLALMSNYFLGRHVFNNQSIGVVQRVDHDDISKPDFTNDGELHTITLQKTPNRPVQPGTPFYFSPSPSGFPMLTRHDLPQVTGNLSESATFNGLPPGIVVTKAQGSVLAVRAVGPAGAGLVRPPSEGDYAFTTPTRVRPVALAAWGAVPNMQFFWLLDAISQNRPVPASYLGTLVAYAGCQIGAFLSLAVALFQKRDVG